MPMKEEVLSYIQEYLERKGFKPKEVEPSDSLKMYFDSIDEVIFFADLEERFDVSPSLEEELECEYLSEVCELIVSKRKEKENEKKV